MQLNSLGEKFYWLYTSLLLLCIIPVAEKKKILQDVFLMIRYQLALINFTKRQKNAFNGNNCKNKYKTLYCIYRRKLVIVIICINITAFLNDGLI